MIQEGNVPYVLIHFSSKSVSIFRGEKKKKPPRTIMLIMLTTLSGPQSTKRGEIQ